MCEVLCSCSDGQCSRMWETEPGAKEQKLQRSEAALPIPVHVRREGGVVSASQPGQVDPVRARKHSLTRGHRGRPRTEEAVRAEGENGACCVCMCVRREVLEGVGGSVLKCCL